MMRACHYARCINCHCQRNGNRTVWLEETASTTSISLALCVFSISAIISLLIISMLLHWCVLDEIRSIRTNTTPITLSPLLAIFQPATDSPARLTTFFCFLAPSLAHYHLFKTLRYIPISMWMRKTWAIARRCRTNIFHRLPSHHPQSSQWERIHQNVPKVGREKNTRPCYVHTHHPVYLVVQKVI